MARGRREGKKIDSVAWEVFAGNLLGISAGVSAFELRSGQTGIGFAGSETLLRTRGHLLAFLDGIPVPGDLVQVAVGMRLASEGTGATVTVSPFTEASYPWFYHEIFVLGYEEAVTDVVDMPVITAIRIPIDDKAMRRIRPEEEIQMVIENTTLGTAQAVNVTLTGRWLFGH